MNEIVYDSLMHHPSISVLPFMQLKNMYSTPQQDGYFINSKSVNEWGNELPLQRFLVQEYIICI